MGVVILLAFIIFAFQGSAGPITFIHAQETIVDSAMGITNMFLFSTVMITSWLGPWIATKSSTLTMFIVFSACTLTATIYVHFVVKDTTYIYIYENNQKSPVKRWMTLEEKKLLYTPTSLI